MSFENMQDNSNNRIAKEFSDFFTVKLSFFQYFPIVYFFFAFFAASSLLSVSAANHIRHLQKYQFVCASHSGVHKNNKYLIP